jgi:hypothetical protein
MGNQKIRFLHGLLPSFRIIVNSACPVCQHARPPPEKGRGYFRGPEGDFDDVNIYTKLQEFSGYYLHYLPKLG